MTAPGAGSKEEAASGGRPEGEGPGADREVRPYDLPPMAVPLEYQDEPPAWPGEESGRLAVDLDDRTVAVGLQGLAVARAMLAQHSRSKGRGGVAGPAERNREAARHFTRQAHTAAAAWHQAGCPTPDVGR